MTFSTDTTTLHVVARTILIIEDSIDAAESLKEVLELDQHHVELAHTGDDGVARARAHPPELVICDIGLPGMDGYDVARALRRDPRFARTHLVALSGYAQREDRDRAREAGFDTHLAKPPDLDLLAHILAHLPSHA